MAFPSHVFRKDPALESLMSMPNKLLTASCSCSPDSCEVVVAPLPVVEGNGWAGRSDFEF